MGRKAKVGKQRRDRFYHLAKETGYRSRASFKLIQLNRKFEFLQKSRVCIDLCAAPGGWLQVAVRHMPVSSVVVGVDLVPIKPIPGTITLQNDITTQSCRAALKKELKTWKADVVLNDGAPNVGRSWLHDAYTQSCLTLSALQLASEFLVKGGWFVTKVFRSKDYNALMWAFSKLFRRVHATKPQASRNESAEIFVVCQGYLAPDRVDPKFFDPKHIFEDVPLAEADLEKQKKAALLRPVHKQKKAKAEGYDEDRSLNPYKQVTAAEFILETNHFDLLSRCNMILMNPDDGMEMTEGAESLQNRILAHPLTTTEIRESCADVKVLGKRDILHLIRWRKKIRADLVKPETKSPTDGETGETGQTGETSAEIDMGDLETDGDGDEVVEDEEAKLAKKKRRKEMKDKRKTADRLNLKMTHKNDESLIQEDVELFSFSQIAARSQAMLEQFHEVDLSDVEFEETRNEEGEEEFVDKRETGTTAVGTGKRRPMVAYDRDDPDGAQWNEGDEDAPAFLDDPDARSVVGRDPLSRARRPGGVKEVDMDDVDEDQEDDDQDDDQDDGVQVTVPDLSQMPEIGSSAARQRAMLFFQKDIFNEINEEDDFETELMDDVIDLGAGRGGQPLTGKQRFERLQAAKLAARMARAQRSDDIPFDSDEEEDRLKPTSGKRSGPDDSMASDDDEEQFQRDLATSQGLTGRGISAKCLQNVVLTAEEMALGARMIRSSKARRDITDGGWNRFMRSDTDLAPRWFRKDEERHFRKPLPVGEDEVAEFADRDKPLDARGIKRVVEAKARKKKRALRRVDRVKKKAEAISAMADMTDKEKSIQIRNLYKSAMKKAATEKKVTVVVAKKGRSRARPAGVKGRYKMVDPRLKKDKRAADKADGRSTSKSSSSAGGGGKKKPRTKKPKPTSGGRRGGKASFAGGRKGKR